MINDKAMDQLLKKINGHPYTLNLISSLIKSNNFKSLAQDLGLFLEDNVIKNSMKESFSKINETARKIIPFFSIFSNQFHLSTMVTFLQEIFKYLDDYKNLSITNNNWKGIFNELLILGLVEEREKNFFVIHPIFHEFLKKILISQLRPLDYSKALKLFPPFLVFLISNLFPKILIRDSLFLKIINYEENNFVLGLNIANRENDWRTISSIIQLLLKYYEDQGRITDIINIYNEFKEKFNENEFKESYIDKIIFQEFLIGYMIRHEHRIEMLNQFKLELSQLRSNLIWIKTIKFSTNIRVLEKSILEHLGAEPRITRRNATIGQEKEHKEWSSIRQAVERTIGRAVCFLRKNKSPFRGRERATVWVKMGYLLILMFGLSCYMGNEPELAHCISLFQ
jgi:hypothetical protein